MHAPKSPEDREQAGVGVLVLPGSCFSYQGGIIGWFGAYFIILCFVTFRKDVSDGPMERQVNFGCWKYAVGITAIAGEHRARIELQQSLQTYQKAEKFQK